MTPITPTPIVAKNRSICQSTTGDDNARSLHPSTAPHGRQTGAIKLPDLGQGFQPAHQRSLQRYRASPASGRILNANETP
jgi:hypothetical protein